MLSKKSKPFYRELAEKFRSFILIGQWVPGAIIPSEKELSGQFGVSRNTIRKALDDLIREGRIERRAGKGTWVVEQKPARDIWRIEGSLLAYPFPELISIEILGLDTIIADFLDPAIAGFAKNEIITCIRAVRRLRESPFALSKMYMPEAVAQSVMEAFDFQKDVYFYNVLERVTGRRAAYTEESFQAVAAVGEIAQTLNVLPQTPVMQLTRLYKDIEGNLMQASQIHYRSDILKIKVTRTREDVV